jgi:hypothetical protein
MAAAQVAIPGFDHMVLPTKGTNPKPQGKNVEHVVTYAALFCSAPRQKRQRQVAQILECYVQVRNQPTAGYRK